MRTFERRGTIQMIGAAVGLWSIGARPLSAADLAGLSPGMPFPDVIYRTEDGQTKTVGGSRGKVSMLYFWAVWCPICYNDIVNVQVIYNNLKTDPGFSPIILNIMDDYKKGVSWARGRGITLPLSDSGMESRNSTMATTTAGTFLFPRYTPQFYVLDRTGNVSFTVAGNAAGTQANLDAIRKLLTNAV